jgi:hypothetical protein
LSVTPGPGLVEAGDGACPELVEGAEVCARAAGAAAMSTPVTDKAHAYARLLSRIVFTIALLVVSAAPATAQPAAPEDDPFANASWHLQFAGHGAVETWNYNTSREVLWGAIPGFTYGLRDGLTLTATYPLYFVAQRGVDAWAIGTTIGVRGRIFRKGRTTVFWEFDVGASKADVFTPPRGTRFNYLALGGGGATVRLRAGVHVIGSLRWIHVSNNGLAGRHRNPDIEAVGPQVGLLVAF